MKPYAGYKPSGVPWLGDVPGHWEVNYLRHVLVMHYGDALAADVRVDGSVPVYGSNGIVGTHNTSNTDAPAIIVGRKGSYGKLNFSESAAFCIDTAYHIGARDCDGCLLRFIYYALMPLGLDTTSQDTGVPGLSREIAYRTKISVPPADEQQAIADYLDTETARIDTLIREKDGLIGLLKEWRQSVIAEAVTKGLAKNAAMKPSGVPWLGDVPAHWSVEKLKFFVGFAGGGTPSKDNPDYWGGSIPWVSPKDMKRPRISETEDYITATGQMNSPCTLIPPLSVLAVVRSGILQHSIPVALNTVPVTLNQDMKALLPTERVDSRFLAFQISGCQKELREEWVKQGATVESIEHQRMADSELGLPPVSEQQAIADYLDTETAKIDDLITHTHDEIAVLKELRAATIADAVLGRIDVRTAAHS